MFPCVWPEPVLVIFGVQYKNGTKNAFFRTRRRKRSSQCRLNRRRSRLLLAPRAPCMLSAKASSAFFEFWFQKKRKQKRFAKTGSKWTQDGTKRNERRGLSARTTARRPLVRPSRLSRSTSTPQSPERSGAAAATRSPAAPGTTVSEPARPQLLLVERQACPLLLLRRCYDSPQTVLRESGSHFCVFPMFVPSLSW